MRGRPVVELVLSCEEEAALRALTRRGKTAQSLAMRARIVLLCAEGLSNKAAAERLGVDQGTVGKWRRRFA